MVVGPSILFYEHAAAQLEALLAVMGIASAMLLWIALVLVHRVVDCAAFTAHVLVVCLSYATAAVARQSVSPWADVHRRYSLFHGLWHVQVAQAQYVLVTALAEDVKPPGASVGTSVVASAATTVIFVNVAFLVLVGTGFAEYWPVALCSGTATAFYVAAARR